MSIEWGPEIPVNGKRPDWLRDEVVSARGRCTGQWYNRAEFGENGHALTWAQCDSIRLPADHPYYAAAERGFTYWPGGDAAPEDWDGGSVLWGDGDIAIKGRMVSRKSGMWVRKLPIDGLEIIGYRRRKETPWQPDQATIDHVAEKLRAAGHWAAVDLIAPRPADPDVGTVAAVISAWYGANPVCWFLDPDPRRSDFQAALAAYKKAKAA